MNVSKRKINKYIYTSAKIPVKMSNFSLRRKKNGKQIKIPSLNRRFLRGKNVKVGSLDKYKILTMKKVKSKVT